MAQHGTIEQLPDPVVDEAGEGEAFFVTVINGSQMGFLLGPFSRHSEALAFVDIAKAEAKRMDSRAEWYAYGTSKASGRRATLPGLLNVRLFGQAKETSSTMVDDCTCQVHLKSWRQFDCPVHVDCDDNCGALKDPGDDVGALKTSLHHWQFCSLSCGCSHGNVS